MNSQLGRVESELDRVMNSQLGRVESELDREKLVRWHLAESDRIEVTQLRWRRELVLLRLGRALSSSLQLNRPLLREVVDELLVQTARDVSCTILGVLLRRITV